MNISSRSAIASSRAAKQQDAQHVGPPTHFQSGESNAWMFQGIQFHLVSSKTLNAFTTGWGSRLHLQRAGADLDNEDELAAVMSHEYAHIYCRHVGKGMTRNTAVQVGSALLGAGAGYAVGGKDNKTGAAATGAGVGTLVGQFANMSFSRKDEAQADEYGFIFYSHAGWDPNRFGDFFTKLEKVQGANQPPGWLSDHPALPDRIKAAQQRAKALPPEAAQWRRPPIKDVSAFAQFKQVAAQQAAQTPQDTTVQNAKQLLQALPRSCMVPDDPLPPDARQAEQSLARTLQGSERRHK